jgi:hypothetical protein
VEEHAFTLPKPAESGFHIVQTPMTLEALERSLFEITPSDVLRREFRSLNRHLGERVKPGQMVIFSDSRNYMCGREEAQMMAAAEKVNEALKDLTDEEASFMVEHHEVIEPFLGVSSGALGVASFMVGQHMETLKNTLKELERLHMEQYRQHGHLKSPDFFGSSRITGKDALDLHEKEFAIPVTVRHPFDDLYSIVYSFQLTGVHRPANPAHDAPPVTL